MANSFNRLLDGIRLIERFFVVSIFISMAVLFTFTVIIRGVPGNYASHFTWIEEAVRLLNIYLVFIGLGLALEKGKHISISSLKDILPIIYSHYINRIIDFVGFLFSVYLCTLSYRLMIFIDSTGQISPTLGIPMSLMYFAPVVGFFLLAFRYFMSFFKIIDRFKVYENDEDGGINDQELLTSNDTNIKNKR